MVQPLDHTQSRQRIQWIKTRMWRIDAWPILKGLAHPIVYCTSYCFAHLIVLHFCIAHFTLISLFLPYICSCVVLLSLTHRPRYPHTPDHNHQITNYHHLYPLPSPHISLLTSFPRRLVSRLYAIHYLLPYLLETWSSNLPFLQEQDKDCYLPICELYMTISVGSHLFESAFCLC